MLFTLFSKQEKVKPRREWETNSTLRMLPLEGGALRCILIAKRRWRRAMSYREFYDLTRLFLLRDKVESLDLHGPPQAIYIAGGGGNLSRVGILSGSFNPPTNAHIELCQRATNFFSRLPALPPIKSM
jgi:hypothetical protein